MEDGATTLYWDDTLLYASVALFVLIERAFNLREQAIISQATRLRRWARRRCRLPVRAAAFDGGASIADAEHDASMPFSRPA